jgi:hypothetical protein
MSNDDSKARLWMTATVLNTLFAFVVLFVLVAIINSLIE